MDAAPRWAALAAVNADGMTARRACATADDRRRSRSAPSRPPRSLHAAQHRRGKRRDDLRALREAGIAAACRPHAADCGRSPPLPHASSASNHCAQAMLPGVHCAGNGVIPASTPLSSQARWRASSSQPAMLPCNVAPVRAISDRTMRDASQLVVSVGGRVG